MEWLAGVIGVVVGVIVTLIFQLILPTSGTLRIDHSNPEKDIYRFEINDLDKLNKKKRVTLKIDHNADLSQK